MEICWLTTSNCNQSCKYCDRFLEKSDISDEDYLAILHKLISYNVKRLTFGGGESLLVGCFGIIVQCAAEHGIHLKLVTNGKLLPQNENLLQYFDEITLSLDSADPNINTLMGRGADHFSNVSKVIGLIKKATYRTRVNINTVVTKINLGKVIELASHIQEWDIQQWRIFRFCPLRETAVLNRNIFEIDAMQFQSVKTSIEALELKCLVQFRDYEDMENGYLLITPAGNLCVSRDLKDVVVGSMLSDDLSQWFMS